MTTSYEAYKTIPTYFSYIFSPLFFYIHAGIICTLNLITRECLSHCSVIINMLNQCTSTCAGYSCAYALSLSNVIESLSSCRVSCSTITTSHFVSIVSFSFQAVSLTTKAIYLSTITMYLSCMSWVS